MGVLLSSAAAVTLSSVICNVIGSAILHHIHPQARYNVLWASRNGAVGGAILTVPWMLIFRLLNACVARTSSEFVQEMVGYAGWVVTAANSAAAGALGAAVLIASLDEGKVKQGVRESAAAGGVGSGVWLAALMAASLVIMMWMLAVHGVDWIRRKIDNKRQRVAKADAAGEQHELGQVGWQEDGGVAPSQSRHDQNHQTTAMMPRSHGIISGTQEGSDKV